MYNGVINIYKERGFTSFDVVAKLRSIFHQKKIGHTGTLDPDAEGVLVVCLGNATKLCEILTDKDKCYEVVLLLGKTSDTEDISGKILTECEVTATEDEIRAAILSFIGEYEQIPPMYSAIKMNGKKLYELARQGKEVERIKRSVVIHNIEIISIDLPRVVFRVSCGKGTYIRSLCRDIGEKVGCGGLMEQLVRNSVNSTETGIVFRKEDALTLDEVENLVKSGKIEEKILPVDYMFPNLIKVMVQGEGTKKLRNGNILKTSELQLISDSKDDKEILKTKEIFEYETGYEEENSCHLKYVKMLKDYEQDGVQCLVYSEDEIFTAIYQYNSSLHAWKAFKMFFS